MPERNLQDDRTRGLLWDRTRTLNCPSAVFAFFVLLTSISLSVHIAPLAIRPWRIAPSTPSRGTGTRTGLLFTADPKTMSIANSHSIAEGDIDSVLVTEVNPARDDGTLDYARCAALHNYIVQYGWAAEGRSLEDLPRQSYWEQWREEAESVELEDRLDPALQAFLQLAHVGGGSDDVTKPLFFFWVEGLAGPQHMLERAQTFPENLMGEDPDRVVCLYYPNGMSGHKAGLMYDQQNHRAYFSMTIWEFDHASPIHKHKELWHPLETVFSRWIEMIRTGKITASGRQAQSEKYGVWAMHSYGERQVDSAVDAFHRLVDAIEQRMPPDMRLEAGDHPPLLTDKDLDAAQVPQDCFVRSVLTKIRKPRFNKIAPGLLVPHDADAFVAAQRFTTVGKQSPDRSNSGITTGDGSVGGAAPDDVEDNEGTHIPPVLLFAAESGQRVNLDQFPNSYTAQHETEDSFVTLNPFCKPYSAAVKRGDHATPAGLYSESVCRGHADIAEEGFRLLLPFASRLAGQQVVGGEEHLGARLSDGSLIEVGNPTQLFQHGIKPFGGDVSGRPQRLERLFDKWRELLEDGIWSVGNNGVEGDIEKFQEAGGPRWRSYWIAPSW